MTVFFTADQHFGHSNIIQYCNRPFDSVKEMDDVIINNHNSVVSNNDIVVHIGDISFVKTFKLLNEKYLNRLNGRHKFVRGNHDYWATNEVPYILEQKVNGRRIVCCHYAMRTWNRSHYNEWHLFGHSHGTVSGIGKSLDVGVDCNNFTPVSFEDIESRMNLLPDNIGRIQ